MGKGVAGWTRHGRAVIQAVLFFFVEYMYTSNLLNSVSRETQLSDLVRPYNAVTP